MSVNNERHLNTFLELVQIDSPSGYEQLVLEYCQKRFADIGVTAAIDEHHNMRIRLPGHGQPFLLSAHMDTVEPGRGIVPVVWQGRITSAGDTILGADNKAGLAAILELCTALWEDKKEHQSLEIVLTCNEEIGIVGAQAIAPGWLSARSGITVDGSDINQIVTCSPFIHYIDVEILGKAAHSGVEPEKGINALKTAARVIDSLTLGRIDEDTTLNIGGVQSGTVRNCIPSFCSLQCETRSYDNNKALAQVEKLRKAFKSSAKIEGTRIKYESWLACHGYSFDPQSDLLLGRLAANMQRNGLEPAYRKMGGGSDANAFNKMGIQTVNIGCGAQNPHTREEQLAIADLQVLPRSLYSLVCEQSN